MAKEQLTKLWKDTWQILNDWPKKENFCSRTIRWRSRNFIVNTTSIDEARTWLSTDPGVQANRWEIEILPYTSRIGAVWRAKEPYEMVNYNFIRFVEKPKAAENAEVFLKQHQEFVLALKKSGNIIPGGIFEPRGSILILKGEIKDNLFESDPAIQHGIISMERKILWIAKGSFCEQE
jgi:hypothetical protein